MGLFIDVELRNTETGQSGIYHDDYRWDIDNEYGLIYCWLEGNFGCDCNRSICLWRALHPELPGNTMFTSEEFVDDDVVLDCSDWNKNIVLIAIRERGTGRVIYSEIEGVICDE